MKKKLFPLLLALALTAQLVPGALACNHTELNSPADTVTSPWAVEEIGRAKDLSLVSGYVDTTNTTAPIDRREYCRMAMQYLTVEQNQTTFWSMVAQFMAEKDEQGQVPNAFTDCDDYYDPPSIRVTLAHTVGLVEGVGNGRYEPTRNISRQEAAVLLARAYKTVGGELPSADLAYADADRIADWAQESVAAVTALGVMQGVGDNRFDPTGSYTTEQCIATFLRLYEKAPVSRPNGNVERLFSYEQVMDDLAQQDNNTTNPFRISYQLDGEKATLVQTTYGGGTSFFTTFYLVGRDGSEQVIDPNVCNYSRYPGSLTSRTELKNPAFSAGGDTLTFTITLDSDMTAAKADGTAVLLHAKGDYLCTVDVATGQCTAVIADAP